MFFIFTSAASARGISVSDAASKDSAIPSEQQEKVRCQRQRHRSLAMPLVHPPRSSRPMTLTIGEYREPQSPYSPSVRRAISMAMVSIQQHGSKASSAFPDSEPAPITDIRWRDRIVR